MKTKLNLAVNFGDFQLQAPSPGAPNQKPS